MTVNYIRNLKRTMHNSTEDYENGYRQCSEEMWRLIYSLPNIVPEQRERLAHRCRQMWSTRRFAQHHHPYQRRAPIINEQYPLQKPQPSSSSPSHLKILVNHPAMTNPSNLCSSLASTSSNGSSSSLSPSSPKLWKPYM